MAYSPRDITNFTNLDIQRSEVPPVSEAIQSSADVKSALLNSDISTSDTLSVATPAVSNEDKGPKR